jgi:hypothetical protein
LMPWRLKRWFESPHTLVVANREAVTRSRKKLDCRTDCIGSQRRRWYFRLRERISRGDPGEQHLVRLRERIPRGDPGQHFSLAFWIASPGMPLCRKDGGGDDSVLQKRRLHVAHSKATAAFPDKSVPR